MNCSKSAQTYRPLALLEALTARVPLVCRLTGLDLLLGSAGAWEASSQERTLLFGSVAPADPITTAAGTVGAELVVATAVAAGGGSLLSACLAE